MTAPSSFGKWPLYRDALLFAVAAVGIIHEEFFAVAASPELLALYGALLGLPAYLQLRGGNGK